MSGPKTRRYRLTATLLRRAEEALRRLEEQRRDELDAMRQQQEAERQRLLRQQRIDLESAIERAQQRLERIAEALQRARQQFPDEPLILPEAPLQRPASDDLSGLASHLSKLESFALAQETTLAGELARLNANASMRQTLAGLLRYATVGPLPNNEANKALSKTAAKPDPWIQRLDLLPGQAPPAEVTDIVAELQTAPAAKRPALETELTWRIQCFNATQKAEEEFQRKASALYKALPPPETPTQVELLSRLAQAATGKLPQDEDLLAEANTWHERAQAQTLQRQAAAVLRESLQELGYEVEEGFSTLFVAGGMVHFTRPEWQGYYARVRVRPGDSYLNFNLVRADVGPLTLEQQRCDHEAETRWCSEYRRLIEHLAQGGLDTEALRELPPGAVPIQGVPVEQLPAGATAKSKPNRPAPLRRRVAPDSCRNPPTRDDPSCCLAPLGHRAASVTARAFAVRAHR